jgi:hypothetical protein
MTDSEQRTTPNGPNVAGEYQQDSAPNTHATTVPVVEFKKFQPRRIEQAEIEVAQLPPTVNQVSSNR